MYAVYVSCTSCTFHQVRRTAAMHQCRYSLAAWTRFYTWLATSAIAANNTGVTCARRSRPSALSRIVWCTTVQPRLKDNTNVKHDRKRSVHNCSVVQTTALYQLTEPTYLLNDLGGPLEEGATHLSLPIRRLGDGGYYVGAVPMNVLCEESRPMCSSDVWFLMH